MTVGSVGRGHAPGHHGEILQGVFLDAAGRPCPGLVTLPMSGPGTRAEFTRAPGDRVTVEPRERTKAARAATLAVAECARRTGQPPGGGGLRLRSDLPVGLGMGSSTSDVLAAVRAVAASYDVTLPAADLARLAVRAEQACDPLMLDGRPLLFAQREGRVLEDLGAALPPTVVVGCLTSDGAPVDTLTLPRAEHDVRAFEWLRGLLRRAIAESDVALLGRVSTQSARYNQRVLAKPEFGVLEHIAEHTGAAGVQVAHSGNVAGLLFDATAPGLARRLRRCVRALRRNDITVTRIFGTRNGGRAWTTTSPTPSAGRTWCEPATVSSAFASRR
ncbi:GHMP family kinase ATP-binding protein [Prauserella flavalba]|uniref:GHMP kinase n=1 Tax=Prauserella flavalba TaxID=1477506 RepID=A0A318M7L9_9PSEU|nr:GHMP kinase [Prauserella flavalba]PXY30776.1 GHMP kinase [Prauserella flavalba]